MSISTGVCLLLLTLIATSLRTWLIGHKLKMVIRMANQGNKGRLLLWLRHNLPDGRATAHDETWQYGLYLLLLSFKDSSQFHMLFNDNPEMWREANVKNKDTWTMAWDWYTTHRIRSANDTDGPLMESCRYARSQHPEVRQILMQLLSMDLNFAQTLDLAEIARPFPHIRVEALRKACPLASGPAERTSLKGVVEKENDSLVWVAFAETECISDILCSIMAQRPVASREWQIAFDKLKEMDNPALEDSSSYALP